MSEIFTRFGLLCAAGMLVTLLVTGLWYRRRGIGYGVWVRLCALGIPMAWFCARLAYCLTNIPYYVDNVENPMLMLRFWDGGFSLFGALIGLMLAAVLTARWQRIKAAMLLDGVSLGALPGIVIVRLAQTGTGIGIGRDIRSEWLQPIGVTENLWHPVYLYQAVVTAVILLILLVWLRAVKGTPLIGDVTLVFATLYGCAEVVLESLCKDGHMTVHDNLVHIHQILAIVLPVAALVVWSIRLAKKDAKKSQHNTVWLIVAWIIVVACIGLGINQEFAVDRHDDLVLEYGIMVAAMAVVAATALIVRRKANA